jgi:hypothetical protein
LILFYSGKKRSFSSHLLDHGFSKRGKFFARFVVHRPIPDFVCHKLGGGQEKGRFVVQFSGLLNPMGKINALDVFF